MSTVQVSNVHFESTGNNRIQVEGSNLSIFSSGSRFITANATDLTLTSNGVSTTLGSSTTAGAAEPIGTYKLSVGTANDSYVVTDNVYSRTTYSQLYAVVGDQNGYVRLQTQVSGFTIDSQDLTSQVTNVRFGNGRFLLTRGPTGNVHSSTNGTTWTVANSTMTDGFEEFVFANTTFVAATSTGTANNIKTSTDGVTWTSRASTYIPYAYRNFPVVAYGNGITVVLSGSTPAKSDYYRSTDSTNFSTQSYPFSVALEQAGAIVYGSNGFILTTGNTIYRSTDAITWSTVGNTGGYAMLWCAYGNGRYVLSGYETLTSSGVSGVQTSTNGTTWNPPVAPVIDLSFTQPPYNVLVKGFVNNTFVADIVSTYSAHTCVSTDGITWDFVKRPVTANGSPLTPVNDLGRVEGVASNGTIVVFAYPGMVTVSTQNTSNFYVPPLQALTDRVTLTEYMRSK